MYFSLKSQWWYFHTFSDTPTLFTHLTHSGLLILCWEIGKILSKITKNLILPNFDTISNILQSVVLTQEKIIHIWNQLMKTVILIPINPIKSTKKFHEKGSPFEFANLTILEQPLLDALELLLMSWNFFWWFPGSSVMGKATLFFWVSAKWLTLTCRLLVGCL